MDRTAFFSGEYFRQKNQDYNGIMEKSHPNRISPKTLTSILPEYRNAF